MPHAYPVRTRRFLLIRCTCKICIPALNSASHRSAVICTTSPSCAYPSFHAHYSHTVKLCNLAPLPFSHALVIQTAPISAHRLPAVGPQVRGIPLSWGLLCTRATVLGPVPFLALPVISHTYIGFFIFPGGTPFCRSQRSGNRGVQGLNRSAGYKKFPLER